MSASTWVRGKRPEAAPAKDDRSWTFEPLEGFDFLGYHFARSALSWPRKKSMGQVEGDDARENAPQPMGTAWRAICEVR